MNPRLTRIEDLSHQMDAILSELQDTHKTLLTQIDDSVKNRFLTVLLCE